MTAIAILILASLPVPQVQISNVQISKVQVSTAIGSQPLPHFKQIATAPRKGGVWYFARTGHAVYCYGPVMTLPNRDGEIERVATFCKGNQLLVPLKD
ncbi:MAG TPA: hypothetical protein VFA90_11320 [Terriglobales bacterium]|nr:hypothetical protein [Terriglobales bacterium]